MIWWILATLFLVATPAWPQAAIRSADQRPLHIIQPPQSSVVLGTDSTRRLVNATVQGAGDSKVQLASGSTVTSHVPIYDANGGLVDSGAVVATTPFQNATSASMALTFYGGVF